MTVQRRSAPRLELFGGPKVIMPSGAALQLSPTHELLLTLVWGHESTLLSRPQAIWLLWEEDDTSRARHKLRQLLYETRNRIGVEAVAASDEMLSAAHGAIRCDLEEFRRLLQSERPAEAWALESKGFASGARRVPTGDYERWMAAKRTGLRRDVRESALRSWENERTRGGWQAALEAAQVLRSLDPQNESAVQKVMQAQAMAGDAVGAEATFSAFSAALPSRSSPAKETLALLGRIGELAAPKPEHTDPAVDALPLIGRQPCLDALRRSLSNVWAGNFEIVALRGEGGIGKTRLLNAARKEAQLQGFRCLYAGGAEVEAQIPFNILIDALNDPALARHMAFMEEPARAVLADIVPALRSGTASLPVPALQESGIPRRLLDAFAEFFALLSNEQPTILFVDDLQWADATSLTVLEFVQRRWRRGALGIFASVRSDVVTPLVLAPPRTTGGKGLRTTIIEVLPLPPGDAEMLVGALSGSSIAPADRDELMALAGGNPLFLIELTQDYVADRIQLSGGTAGTVPFPLSLRDVLAPRLDRLTTQATQVASVLSVAGRSLKLSEIAALSDLSEEECLAVVEELSDKRLVGLAQHRISIVHEMFRAALYHRISEPRRALLHRSIARYLEHLPSPPYGECAVHYGRAGDGVEAARFGRLAADVALSQGARAEAVHFLQLVSELEPDEHARAAATGDLAHALHLDRNLARAQGALELAAVRLRKVGDGPRALRMEIHRVEAMVELGDTPVGEILERIEAIKGDALRASDDESLALTLDLELHVRDRGGMSESFPGVLAQLESCAESEDPGARCVANAALAMSVLLGDASVALPRARAAVQDAEAHGLSRHLLLAQNRLISVLMSQGMLNTPEGRAVLLRADAQAAESGDLLQRAILEGNRGTFLSDAGELEAAEVHLDRSGALLERIQPGTPHLFYLCNRVDLSLQQGAYDEALGWMEKAEPLLTSSTASYFADQVHAGTGLACLGLGRLAGARRREGLIHSGEGAWRFDPWLITSLRARLLVRRGLPQEALEFVDETAAAIRGRMVSAWIRLVLLSCQIRRRTGQEMPPTLQDALSTAHALSLTTRASELESFLA